MDRSLCIIGTGYVGMASMIGLAELGWSVTGYDIAADRIEKMRLGVTPYREAGIESALRKHIENGRLNFCTSLEEATIEAEIVIVAVGTPARPDGSADLSALFSVVDELSKIAFRGWPTICIRSTVSPGTSDRLAALVEGWGDLIYAPEFLREGAAVADFLNPDRIVVGSQTTAAAIPYVRLFESLQKPVLFTTRCNAELIKCCSNAFLALKISFANEVANLCEAVGGSSDDVLRGIGYDRRIGSDFLRPGIGFGGPCFEKDVKSIHHIAGQHGIGRELFSATLRVNENQPLRVIALLEAELGPLFGKTIGVWGLAFKAGTDDVRDSLAMRILDELQTRGANTIAFDPVVRAVQLPVRSRLALSALEAAKADALLVLTDWPEFANIAPRSYARSIASRLVVDGRNILDAERVASAGLRYRGIGRISAQTGGATEALALC